MLEVTSITVLPLVVVVTPVVYSLPSASYPLPVECVPSEVVENLRGCPVGWVKV